MGKPVSKNAQKSKETVFNVSNELKEAEVWRNKPGSGKEDPLQKEKQSYLDQMILASKDDNLKLIHIAERKLKNVNKADFNDSTKVFSYEDNWSHLEFRPCDTTFYYNIRDSLVTAIHHEYKHKFLWFRWGIKGYKVKHVNFNKNSRIVYNTYVKPEK